MYLIYGPAVFCIALLLVAFIVVRIVAARIRWNQRKEDPRKYDLDLADLQQLLARGQMTQEEYEKAKTVILNKTDPSYQPSKGFPVLAPPQKKNP